jgi:hypothetical protein
VRILHTSFSTLVDSFTSFDSSFLQVFGHFLGLGYFNSPKLLLPYKQAYFPITFNGIMLIQTTTITPTTYLRSWALVALIIVARFMVDHHPFLFEPLA